mgnify:CR=1 FL=1
MAYLVFYAKRKSRKERLSKNPLRILDCKVDANHEAVLNAPKINDYLNEKSLKYFNDVIVLLNKYGMMTLAEDEEGFSPYYKGNPEERDSVYHQGPTWPWLLGLYYNSIQNMIKTQKTNSIKSQT